ncbi:HEPN/Toprim-associated domain-containing protein [Type-D symbiont of Plautia stali]|uniref:HEPN/Toprim-associated domain-containing protein n=1 Tax=Type-D symbiont of Plautia stali TaxID=1560356 RepID=UPI00073ED780
MSTLVGAEIDGLSVEDYQNHHSTWVFKRSDRVREHCERDENGRLPDGAFIGFRASAAAIRRRMALVGF